MPNILDRRSDRFTIILNDNELNLFKNSRYIKQTICCCEKISPIYISVIYHDKDFDVTINHVKTPHYHIVMLINNRCRLLTMINIISDLFHCNTNQIQIDVCNSLEGQTRYLLHSDDMDKYQYQLEDIETNNKGYVVKCFELIEIADLYDCVNVVRKFHYNLEQIMLNVRNYDKWRKYILDLIRNFKV